MRIELITKEQHSKLKSIFEKFPVLTLQNVGYEYIGSEFTKEEKEAFEVVTEILRKAVKGFSEFSNFRLTPKGEIQIRLQYNYSWDNKGLPFIGVGYILLDELLNGFNKIEQSNN